MIVGRGDRFGIMRCALVSSLMRYYDEFSGVSQDAVDDFVRESETGRQIEQAQADRRYGERGQTGEAQCGG